VGNAWFETVAEASRVWAVTHCRAPLQGGGGPPSDRFVVGWAAN